MSKYTINKIRYKKNKQGFTLVEMIIYIALFAIIFTGFVGIFLLVDKSNKSAIQAKALQNVSIFLSQHLEQSFASADSVDVVTNPNSLLITTLSKAVSNQTAIGTGADGICTVSSSININLASCSGRVNPDGVNTTSIVNTLSGSSTIVVASVPSGMVVGDEIIIMNMKGTSTDYGSVGVYEIRRITAINSTTLTLNSALVATYDGTTQKIIVQRVPNYTNVNVNSGGTLTASAWNGTTYGVLIFRASGTLMVSSGGIIDMNAKGYRQLGNLYNYAFGTDAPGNGGETYNGSAWSGCNYNGSYTCPDPSSGVSGGGGGSSNALSPLTGTVGGGGGGAGWNFGNKGAYGGGGGYGSAGSGANNGTAITGGNGGTSIVGDSGDGGGGGTYGDVSLTRLMLGSAGGYGDGNDTAGNSGQPEGGHGGGIIAIYANNIFIGTTGIIRSNGGSSTDGGGGSGGSVFIKTNTASIGSSLITASGGTSHYNGGNGRIAIFYSSTLSGTTTPLAYSSKGDINTTAGFPVNYFNYLLADNGIKFYTGLSLTTSKDITNSDYVQITSMSFDLIKNLSSKITGVRVTINLQSRIDPTIKTTMQTVYSLK